MIGSLGRSKYPPTSMFESRLRSRGRRGVGYHGVRHDVVSSARLNSGAARTFPHYHRLEAVGQSLGQYAFQRNNLRSSKRYSCQFADQIISYRLGFFFQLRDRELLPSNSLQTPVRDSRRLTCWNLGDGFVKLTMMSIWWCHSFMTFIRAASLTTLTSNRSRLPL